MSNQRTKPLVSLAAACFALLLAARATGKQVELLVVDDTAATHTETINEPTVRLASQGYEVNNRAVGGYNSYQVWYAIHNTWLPLFKDLYPSGDKGLRIAFVYVGLNDALWPENSQTVANYKKYLKLSFQELLNTGWTVYCADVYPVIDEYLWERHPELPKAPSEIIADYNAQGLYPAASETPLLAGVLPFHDLFTGHVDYSFCSWMRNEANCATRDGNHVTRADTGSVTTGSLVVTQGADVIAERYRAAVEQAIGVKITEAVREGLAHQFEQTLGAPLDASMEDWLTSATQSAANAGIWNAIEGGFQSTANEQLYEPFRATIFGATGSTEQIDRQFRFTVNRGIRDGYSAAIGFLDPGLHHAVELFGDSVTALSKIHERLAILLNQGPLLDPQNINGGHQGGLNELFIERLSAFIPNDTSSVAPGGWRQYD